MSVSCSLWNSKFISHICSAPLLGLLYPETDGTTVLWDISNYLPVHIPNIVEGSPSVCSGKYKHSNPSFRSHRTVTSIMLCLLTEWTLTWMSSAIHQDVIKKCVFPSEEVISSLRMFQWRNILLVKYGFSHVTNFTTSEPLSLVFHVF